MRTMKCTLVYIIVVGLVLQGFIGQVFAADAGDEIAKLNAVLGSRELLNQTADTGLPLADEEKNVLKSAETQAAYLSNQVAGDVECHEDCTDYIFNKNTCKTVCRDIGTSSGSYSSGGGPGLSLKGLLFLGVLIGLGFLLFP